MNKKHLLLFPSLSILVLLTGTAAAANNMPPRDDWMGQVRRLKEKFKGPENIPLNKEKRDKTCQVAQEKLTLRWQKYSENRQNRSDNMTKGLTALQKRADFFKSQGLNTSELETDIVTLKTLIADYKTAYTTFLTSLGQAKTIPCANYEGKFLPQLKEAKGDWVLVRAKAQAVKEYYQSTIKPDLQDLRSQLEDKVAETEEE